MEHAFAQLPEFSGDVRLVFLCTLGLLSSMSVPEILCTPAEVFFNRLKVHNDVISIRAFYSVRCDSNGPQSSINALAAGFRKHRAQRRRGQRSPRGKPRSDS